MYDLKIDNYSAKALETIFDKNMDKSAKITTDKWKAYHPLFEDYNITQIESNKGMNFIALHTMIASPVRVKPSSHQVKSWIRKTYSSVSDFKITRISMNFATESTVLKAKT